MTARSKADTGMGSCTRAADIALTKATETAARLNAADAALVVPV